MASSRFSCFPFPLLILLVAHQLSVIACSDPDPLQDFCVADTDTDTDTDTHIFVNGLPCRNPQSVNAGHFKTSVLGVAGDTSGSRFGSSVTLTDTTNLPGVNTQGLVLARTDIAAGGVVAPHVHPRASEIVLVIKGKVLVGFVDTSNPNKLFSQVLREGDAFVFPRGLLHFLYNVGHSPVLTISGLNSQNPGASLLPLATFASQPPIPPQVLQKAFHITQYDVDNIRKHLAA